MKVNLPGAPAQLCSGWVGDTRGCPVAWCPVCRPCDPPLEPAPAAERISVPTGDFLDDEDMRG